MIVRRLARPLLSAIFISGGIAALRHPEGHKPLAERAKPFLDKAGVPTDDMELLVRANGAAMVAGGAMLATGKLPRLSSLGLLASLVPTTLTHDFWNLTDPAEKQAQQVQFFKNLSLMGGLLLASVDTAGKPGLSYRAGMAADAVGRSAHTAKLEAKLAAANAKNALPI